LLNAQSEKDSEIHSSNQLLKDVMSTQEPVHTLSSCKSMSFINERFFEELVESIPQGLFIVDDQNKILYHNQAISDLCNLQSSWVGKNLLDCIDQEDRNKFSLYKIHQKNEKKSIHFRINEQDKIHCLIKISKFSDYFIVYVDLDLHLPILEEELLGFKTAVQSASDSILLIDNEGIIFYVNNSFEEQIDSTSENIIGHHIQEFWSDRDPPAVHSDIQQCLKQQKPWEGEMVWKSYQESFIDVDVRITPIQKEKTTEGFICVQRDITKRKEFEEQVANYSYNLEKIVTERTQSLSKLHDIVQLFHTTETLEKRMRLILIAATAGESFQFNRAFILLINKKQTQLIGRIAMGPSSPEEAGRIWEQIKSISHDGTFRGIMQSYLNHAGEGDYYVNQIVKRLDTPLCDKRSILVQAIDQKRVFVVINGESTIDFDHDIISKLESNQFAVFPLFVEGRPLGVLVVDNSITNKPIEQGSMQSLEILTSQAALAIAHAQANEELAKKVKETEQAYSYLRESQEKLIEAGKFAALGQMAATVAHEIRTPLVAIGGFVNLMLKNHSRNDTEYEHLNIVRDEALRLEDVLNRLLFYARPSTPVLEKNDIHIFLHSVLSFLDAEIKHNRIDLITNFSNDIPEFLFDRNLLRQVIINVLQNSIQSMENGGKIYLETELRDAYVRITVNDTGEGIPADQIKKIFEPFFSTKHAGTGLGLHVTKRILESLNGSIEITSEFGKGTTVQIFLPAKVEG
jgi:PAS domain S-box-containing protein